MDNIRHYETKQGKVTGRASAWIENLTYIADVEEGNVVPVAGFERRDLEQLPDTLELVRRVLPHIKDSDLIYVRGVDDARYVIAEHCTVSIAWGRAELEEPHTITISARYGIQDKTIVFSYWPSALHHFYVCASLALDGYTLEDFTRPVED